MAANINRVVLVGNLTRDPELRHTPSGMAVCSLRIAVNTRRKDSSTGQWTEKPNYFDITVWGNQGESCAQYLAKGRPVGSTAASNGASGTRRTARSARRSRSSPTPSSSSAGAVKAAPAATAAISSCPRARRAGPTPTSRAPTTTFRSKESFLAEKKSDRDRNSSSSSRKRNVPSGPGRRKSCFFCKSKVDEVDYKNVNELRRYVSEKGKIRNRRISGACRRHQRQVAVAVKRAREIALLPYVGDK